MPVANAADAVCMYRDSKVVDGPCAGPLWVSPRYFVSGKGAYACERHARARMTLGYGFGLRFVRQAGTETARERAPVRPVTAGRPAKKMKRTKKGRA